MQNQHYSAVYDNNTYTMVNQNFEKDMDANYHIDFISAMTNCRALNYGLDPMEWLQVKLKAGRIIPALATTTASIAGLQTIEMVKYIIGVHQSQTRNANLNLAVPSLMVSEPGAPQKYTLREGLDVTVWDQWTIEGKSDELTLKSLLTQLESKYQLSPRDVFEGSKPIYMHSMME